MSKAKQNEHRLYGATVNSTRMPYLELLRIDCDEIGKDEQVF